MLLAWATHLSPSSLGKEAKPGAAVRPSSTARRQLAQGFNYVFELVLVPEAGVELWTREPARTFAVLTA
jgi:hypothetical protein